VSDGTYVYTVGGRFLSADKNSAAFERFDPQSGQWTKLVDMPTPRGSYGATYIDGRIVAVGGEEPTQVLATAAMYDIAEAKWISLPPMPTARHGEVVAAVGARTAADAFSALKNAGAPASPMHRGEDLRLDAQLQTRSVASSGRAERPGSVFGTLSTRPAPGLDEHGERIRAEFSRGA